MVAEVATAYVSCPTVWYLPHAESQLQAETSEKHTRDTGSQSASRVMHNTSYKQVLVNIAHIYKIYINIRDNPEA